MKMEAHFYAKLEKILCARDKVAKSLEKMDKMMMTMLLIKLSKTPLLLTL